MDKYFPLPLLPVPNPNDGNENATRIRSYKWLLHHAGTYKLTSHDYSKQEYSKTEKQWHFIEINHSNVTVEGLTLPGVTLSILSHSGIPNVTPQVSSIKVICNISISANKLPTTYFTHEQPKFFNIND